LPLGHPIPLKLSVSHQIQTLLLRPCPPATGPHTPEGGNSNSPPRSARLPHPWARPGKPSSLGRRSPFRSMLEFAINPLNHLADRMFDRRNRFQTPSSLLTLTERVLSNGEAPRGGNACLRWAGSIASRLSSAIKRRCACVLPFRSEGTPETGVPGAGVLRRDLAFETAGIPRHEKSGAASARCPKPGDERRWQLQQETRGHDLLHEGFQTPCQCWYDLMQCAIRSAFSKSALAPAPLHSARTRTCELEGSHPERPPA
jgi:hypothetical protein